MRKLAALLVLVASLGPIGMSAELAPESAEQRPEDAKLIQQHIDRVFKAYITKDRATLRATHGNDWRGFLRPSTSIVKGIEGYMQAAEAALTGEYGLKGYEFIEYEIVFYGDTAIVAYIARLTPGRPVPTQPMIRVLDVYAKIDGHWVQAASQTTLHPETLAARGRRRAPVNE